MAEPRRLKFYLQRHFIPSAAILVSVLMLLTAILHPFNCCSCVCPYVTYSDTSSLQLLHLCLSLCYLQRHFIPSTATSVSVLMLLTATLQFFNCYTCVCPYVTYSDTSSLQLLYLCLSLCYLQRYFIPSSAAPVSVLMLLTATLHPFNCYTCVCPYVTYSDTSSLQLLHLCPSLRLRLNIESHTCLVLITYQVVFKSLLNVVTGISRL